MFTRGDERHPCKLADRHALKDLIVDRELTSALWFFHALSPEPPAVEVGRCVEHLGQSCALCFRDGHGVHPSNACRMAFMIVLAVHRFALPYGHAMLVKNRFRSPKFATMRNRSKTARLAASMAADPPRAR